ncbi:MAG: tRNA uridine-5-carboxymethylaminomethyl(34) synthesis enzyme MnmG [Clostridium sp.]|nr:tRNA uridine-5-carboxymethylaminomethyl(34) synthesis enzyme MnmG [Clostridium sp.]
MNYYNAGEYDIVVVGAGHAGIEAALATARLGLKTILCTMSIESVAFMPCNPSVGGTSKGHLVREIDALGGEMGINIDKTIVQSRMLNTSKGPAVHSLRAQADKVQYQKEMRKVLEDTENLYLRQIEVTDILIEDGKAKGVYTRNGGIFYGKAVILATGTYMASNIIIGEANYESGPNALASSKILPKSLEKLGFNMHRFKTGTPVRVHKRSVDFSQMTEQKGDEEIIPFSFFNDSYYDKPKKIDQMSCYLTYTEPITHKIINANKDKSPMFNGSIDGIGARYCPSIEDKVYRFPDKERHQIFLEPEGRDTNEMYVQGMSSSLPEDIQIKMLKTIPAFKDVEVTRTGYAIEYEMIDPMHLYPTLEYKNIKNLYGAGQINGTSGYEEAAAQGIIAGINAGLKIKGQEELIIKRSEGYIGVLIDDLVTKGTNEPYRMLTSRAEYRLLLRQDNADLRLTEIGRKVGLVDDERYEKYLYRKTKIENEINRLKNVQITGTAKTNKILKELGSTELKKALSLYELLRRPELDYFKVEKLDPDRKKLRIDILREVNVTSKYEGYIRKQQEEVDRFSKYENQTLKSIETYDEVKGLRIEAREKLNKLMPMTLGQASRISGVNPADITVMQIHLEGTKRGLRENVL